MLSGKIIVLPDNIISLLDWDKVVIVEEKQNVIKIIEIKITIKVELKKFMIKTSIGLAFCKSEKFKVKS